MDYTSDGVIEGEIFVGGAVNAEMVWSGVLSGPDMSGRGSEVLSGPEGELGLDGHFIERPTSVRVASLVASMGLEGLEATLRSIDGLDTNRPDLAGILS